MSSRRKSLGDVDEALFTAAERGDVAAVEAALNDGADVTATDHEREGWTCLHLAAFWGNTEVCRYLLEHGAQIDARDQASWTPLHRASFHGHADVVAALLESDVDAIKLLDKNGKSAEGVAGSPGVREVFKTKVQQLHQVHGTSA
eukprot:m.72059 g.72059  ORF g.72059 m.72059 type:complete len:145 (-) comp14231_c1_seq2:1369-1803(-)